MREEDGSGTTRIAILHGLTHGVKTAQALAREVGVETAAARRHLENFASAGFVASTFRREGLGRPKKYYEITDAGRELLPRRYDFLVRLMAKAAIRREGTDGLSRLMQVAADEFAADLAGRVPKNASPRERVKAVATILRELGFPVEVEEQQGKLVIVRRDCIFLQVARAHQSPVCEDFDTRLLTNLIGEDVKLTGCIPWGDNACRHELTTKPAGK